jgi:hypothetical protein
MHGVSQRLNQRAGRRLDLRGQHVQRRRRNRYAFRERSRSVYAYDDSMPADIRPPVAARAARPARNERINRDTPALRVASHKLVSHYERRCAEVVGLDSVDLAPAYSGELDIDNHLTVRRFGLVDVLHFDEP